MKKLLLFVTMAASLLFTQCKKEESVSSAGKTVSMTVTAGPGSKTDITDAGAITWSAGDKLYVGDGSKYIGSLTLKSGAGSATGVFTGNVELTDADEGEELTFHFYYLGSADHTSLAKGSTSVDVDFSSQDIIKGTDGKLTNASACHVGYGSATGTVINDVVTDINVMLVSKVAIARFSFTKDSNPYTGALKLSGDNVCNVMTVNFNSTEFACEGTKGEISLTNATSSEKYVMLVPTSETTGEQALTFTGDNVSGSYTLANGIEANKFYGMSEAIAVTLEEAAPDHEYVDLGLSVKWATCNVGAEHPYDYGNYYAWGETAGYNEEMDGEGANAGASYNPGTVKTSYSWAYYKWGSGIGSLGKYVNMTGYGMDKPDGLTTLLPVDDAATKNWGSAWRMPTEADFTELKNNTTRTWYDEGNTEFNGVAGYKCVSKKDGYTDKYIFLPAAGHRDGSDVSGAGSRGYYWSSSLYTGRPDYGLHLYFYSSNSYMDYYDRYYGYTVRPVQ